jgi:hypothetical protein
MSVSAAIEPVEADSTREAHALAFRIAFATAIGFTLGHVLGWDFPFLPALFAAQLLTGSRSLNLRQAVGFAILMTAGCIFSVLIAQIFVETPLVLLLVLALLIFFAFLLLARGQAVPVASILLITTSVVPGGGQLSMAPWPVHSLIAGSILLGAFGPSLTRFSVTRSHERGHQAAGEEGLANCAALANSGALSLRDPIHVQRIAGERHREYDGNHHPSATCDCRLRTAYAFIMGTSPGGVAATAAYLLVSLFPAPAVLFLSCCF